MAKGAFSAEGSKTRGKKFFVSDKTDGRHPRVIIAADEKAARESWAGITGKQAENGSAVPLGTRAGSILREVKPESRARKKETKEK